MCTRFLKEDDKKLPVLFLPSKTRCWITAVGKSFDRKTNVTYLCFILHKINRLQ